MLDLLPAEILHMVDSVTDLASLSRVNKPLHRFLLPFVYASLVIKSDEQFLDRLKIVPLKTCFNGDGSRTILNSLEFVKDLRLVAPIRERLWRRCDYRNYITHLRTQRRKLERGEAHDSLMEDLDSSLRYVLFHLPEKSLRSFSWHLGCCVPSTILGVDGWLASKHNGIQGLSLVTDGTCLNQNTGFDGILQLKDLRSFSWKGFHQTWPAHHQIIRQSLALNCTLLESLELEAIADLSHPLSVCDILSLQPEISEHDDEGQASNITANMMDPPTIKPLPTRLAALRHLSLSHISLKPYEGMMSAVSMEQLQSLKLLCCLHALEFISRLTGSGLNMSLRSFELVSEEVSVDPSSGSLHIVSGFLHSFEGLEELYLSTPASTISLHDMLFGHRASMKRLVLHMRRENDGAPLTLSGDTPGPRSEELGSIFRLVPLECVGLFQSPVLLKQELISTPAAETIKLIHLRVSSHDSPGSTKSFNWFSEPEHECVLLVSMFPAAIRERIKAACMACLRDFAEWAFGPNGLPSLMVIACGDFTRDGRFEQSQALLVREPTTSTDLYRVVSSGVHEHMLDRIFGARQMLGACPVQPTIVRDGHGQ
ncbi:hypothetical protein BDW62DRAFT_203940 [Aspergillus aurantiobrunneus]